MFYGEKAGCQFLSKACTEGPLPGRRECCTSAQGAACTFHYDQKGYCDIDGFTDKTEKVFAYENGDCAFQSNLMTTYGGEVYGSESRCLIGNIVHVDFRWKTELVSLCYKYRCAGRNLIISLSSGAEINCTQGGKNVSVPNDSIYEGYIICPDPSSFCKFCYI